MPLVDGGTGNPYPTINQVMNIARARVNDMMNDEAGDLLANDSPASQTYLTAAWKWLQSACDVRGVQTFIKSIPIYGIPGIQNKDVMNEAWITWAGCSDGVNQFDGPILPQDMISPKSIWRRKSVAANQDGTPGLNTAGLELMAQGIDGLPPYLDFNTFDWRDDGIYFYAAAYAQDWKFRYSAYRPELDITEPDSQITIMMCEDSLGARVAFEYASSRGAAQAPAMEAWAETALDKIPQRATRLKQRQSIRRQGYTGRVDTNRRGWPNLPVNP